MARTKKRRKLSSGQKKQLAVERGQKSANKMGKGAGSRLSFTLPAKWQQETYQRGKKTRVQFSSPGKTRYKTQKVVKETLQLRQMKECLQEESSSCLSSEDMSTDESDSMLSNDNEPSVEEIMERRLFICESTQLMDLVQQINSTSRCSTIDCNGKFI